MTSAGRKGMRTGTGVIKRFFGDAGATFVGIEQESGNVAAFMCEPDLARSLVRKYGAVRDQGGVGMDGIIGLRVEYTESAHGTLVDARPLMN
jgi:hypothetical protein